MAVGDGAPASAQSKARGIDSCIRGGDFYFLVRHVQNICDHLYQIASLAHARLRHIALEDCVGHIADQIGYDPHIGFRVVFADIRISNDAAADAPHIAAVLAGPGGIAPAFPFVLPAKFLRRRVHGFYIADGVGLPGPAVPPGVNVAVRDIIFLVALQGIKISGPHGAPDEQGEAAV